LSNYIFYSEKRNNGQTLTGQTFRRGQKFRLTPVSPPHWLRA